MILLQIFKNRKMKRNGNKSIYHGKELKRNEIWPSFKEKKKHTHFKTLNVKKCCTRLLSAVLLQIRQEQLFLGVKSSQKTTIDFIQCRQYFYSSSLVPQNANTVTGAGQLRAVTLQGLSRTFPNDHRECNED